MNAKTAWVHAA